MLKKSNFFLLKKSYFFCKKKYLFFNFILPDPGVSGVTTMGPSLCYYLGDLWSCCRQYIGRPLEERLKDRVIIHTILTFGFDTPPPLGLAMRMYLSSSAYCAKRIIPFFTHKLPFWLHFSKSLGPEPQLTIINYVEYVVSSFCVNEARELIQLYFCGTTPPVRIGQV